jgi:glucose-1-phosphate adenylyltransferase
MIIAQYRPHSLIEHIGAGGPWDLNRDFTGGIRIYTPFRARKSGWFTGTADAVQQNFSFIKQGKPDVILILSGDHIYSMDYGRMIDDHLENQADMTIATLEMPIEEASRFGIVEIDGTRRITSFIEKPPNPASNLINMGVYIFNIDILDKALWEDHMKTDSSHDFGKDIIPKLIREGSRVFSYPYCGYWVDVGTVDSYWKAQMDLLENPAALDLYNRNWIIHTRSEERPPAKILPGTVIDNSMICDGCRIESNVVIESSIVSPGVYIQSGSVIKESIILTDSVIEKDTKVIRSILDKRAIIGNNSTIGEYIEDELKLTLIGKNSIIPPNTVICGGASIGPDVTHADFSSGEILGGEVIQTRRLPNEI